MGSSLSFELARRDLPFRLLLLSLTTLTPFLLLFQIRRSLRLPRTLPGTWNLQIVQSSVEGRASSQGQALELNRRLPWSPLVVECREF